MRNALKTLALLGIFTASVCAVSLGAQAAPAVALSDSAKAACEAIGTGADCDIDLAKGSDVNDIIKVVINIFSTVVGVVAVIMIILAGFKYITSSGDSGKITSAKNTLIYALIGLVIVALAQTIVKFTLSKSTQTPCTTSQVRDASGVCQPK